MDDPWRDVPGDLDHRVLHYVSQAEKKKLEIRQDLVAKYARILVAAEEVLADRTRGEQGTRDEVARVAAAEHGIEEDDPEKDRAAYAAARRAQREVYNSVTALADRVVRFERLLKPRHKSLQVDVASKFPLTDILAACNVIKDFAVATKPHPANLAEVKLAKSELSLTVAGHTFLWWRIHVPRYKGQWEDMYALARCWHVTDAKDLETFRRRVKKLKPKPDPQGRTYILGCPPRALS